jgi:aminoglycoside 6'-N-acetyltransferase I
MKVVALTVAPNPDWLRLRKALWPDTSDAEHEVEMAQIAAAPERYGQFMACSDDGRPLGLAEVSIRSDYVNGTETSPVAFLEGLYVAPEARRRGIARSLLTAVIAWARARACTELASDTQLENSLSQSVHLGLGFVETERVVYFRKSLEPESVASSTIAEQLVRSS